MYVMLKDGRKCLYPPVGSPDLPSDRVSEDPHLCMLA